MNFENGDEIRENYQATNHLLKVQIILFFFKKKCTLMGKLIILITLLFMKHNNKLNTDLVARVCYQRCSIYLRKLKQEDCCEFDGVTIRPASDIQQDFI